MQDQEEKQSITLQQEADECQKDGEKFILELENPVTYKPFLSKLIQALTKREAALGRYNATTAESYKAIGSLYFQMNDVRAIVMLRTSYRIKSFLYGKFIGHISGKLKELLLRQGFLESDSELMRREILQSMKHETEGDIHRRFGDGRAAALEYQKAAKVEELAFGRDNPDLAYLWRKMACLVAVKKTQHMHLINFERSDRVHSGWMQQLKSHLSGKVCQYIQKGDQYYQAQQYNEAIGEYIKATVLDRRRHAYKKRRRVPQSSDNSLSRERELSLERELKLMLASNLPPLRQDIENQTTEASEMSRQRTESWGTEIFSEDESFLSRSEALSQRIKRFSDRTRPSPYNDYQIDILGQSQDTAKVPLRSSTYQTSDAASIAGSQISQITDDKSGGTHTQAPQSFLPLSLQNTVGPKSSTKSLETAKKQSKAESLLKKFKSRRSKTTQYQDLNRLQSKEVESNITGESPFLVFEDNTSSTPESVSLDLR